MELTGKKIIVLGDRDGIPGPAIEECLKTVDAQVVFVATECFVWTAAGAMDLENQARIKELGEKHGAEELVVILGFADSDSTELAAETVTAGDPTYAGPLTGVQLGLPVYHIMEAEIKNQIDADIYEQQVAMMEMVVEVEALVEAVKNIREEHAQ